MPTTTKTNDTVKTTDTLECPIFHQMSSEEYQYVLELFEHKNYQQDKEILSEGLSVQKLWIILHGRCEVVKSQPDGKTRILAVLEKGAVFGEMSFFHPAPHSATVRAITDVEVMRLSRDNFDRLQLLCPSAAFRIAENTTAVLAERLRRMDEWTADRLDGLSANDNQREEWHEFRAKLYTEWEF